MKLSTSRQSCAQLSANLEKPRVNVSNILEAAGITGAPCLVNVVLGIGEASDWGEGGNDRHRLAVQLLGREPCCALAKQCTLTLSPTMDFRDRILHLSSTQP